MHWRMTASDRACRLARGLFGRVPHGNIFARGWGGSIVLWCVIGDLLNLGPFVLLRHIHGRAVTWRRMPRPREIHVFVAVSILFLSCCCVIIIFFVFIFFLFLFLKRLDRLCRCRHCHPFFVCVFDVLDDAMGHELIQNLRHVILQGSLRQREMQRTEQLKTLLIDDFLSDFLGCLHHIEQRMQGTHLHVHVSRRRILLQNEQPLFLRGDAGAHFRTGRQQRQSAGSCACRLKILVRSSRQEDPQLQAFPALALFGGKHLKDLLTVHHVAERLGGTATHHPVVVKHQVLQRLDTVLPHNAHAEVFTHRRQVGQRHARFKLVQTFARLRQSQQRTHKLGGTLPRKGNVWIGGDGHLSQSLCCFELPFVGVVVGQGDQRFRTALLDDDASVLLRGHQRQEHACNLLTSTIAC
eukprot:m.1313043 g.1313043  ORF g.1313043 m.1313043 type:complete len:410 (-) comp24832_c0_seq1:2168-3397(-)